jgi:stearoyl-CoA desaturase (delta-9 desaturase)
MATATRSLSIPLPNGARISVVGVTPFAIMHLLAFGVFFVPFKWSYLITCVALVFGRMFWVTAGYHRYFAHRSFKTSRVFQFVIAFMAMTSAQKGVLWWAAHHRHHHRFSDQEEDLHSPTLFGFFWSHIGWIVSDRYNDTRTHYIADFAKFPELRWLNKYHWVAPATLGVSLYLIGGLPLDTSKNNWFLALLTLGEGWHNNHHHYMASARQGFFWWEIDITYYILNLFAALGLVWELRLVPAHLLHSDEEEVELAA